MSYPKVTILFSNGNLLQNIAALDGIAGILCTAFTVGNVGKTYQVFSLKDAETKGLTLALEPYAYKHLKDFYAEVGGNQELWVQLYVSTLMQANALDITNENSAIKLVKAAGGKIRLLGITHKAYAVSGANFMEADVVSAVTAGKTFAEGCLAMLMPLRILVEGIIGDVAGATIFAPNTAANGYVGVVIGTNNTNPATDDKSAAVGLALGRAVKFPAHVKIGKVANGPLTATAIRFSTKSLLEMTNLEALHDLGYISFMSHPQKAGFYFGIDRMASNDDYRLLAYGRIVDKAAVIAAAVFIEQLEGEVDVDSAGKILESDCKHLEGKIDQQVNSLMAEQISGFESLVDPNQDIINTNKLTVKLRVRPKGYTSFIEVDLGLTATGI